MLDEPFLVISGDALTDFDLDEIIDFHTEQGGLATLTLYRVPNPLEYGVVIIDEEGAIRQFLEKPSWGEVFSDTVNTGIYVLEPRSSTISSAASHRLQPGRLPESAQASDRAARLRRRRLLVRRRQASESTCAPTRDVLLAKVKLAAHRPHIGGNDLGSRATWRSRPTRSSTARSFLARACKIKGGVIIHGPTVIRDYTVIDARARSIAASSGATPTSASGPSCAARSSAPVQYQEPRGDLRGRGRSATTRSSTRARSSSAKSRSGPSKEVEDGATVSSSIIWGTRAGACSSGADGITGLVNIDLTPEFAPSWARPTAPRCPAAAGSPSTVTRTAPRDDQARA